MTTPKREPPNYSKYVPVVHEKKKFTRNSETLASFVAYCEAHPTERFWQALRNWAKVNFILKFSGSVFQIPDDSQFVDTFNWEGRDK